MKIVAVLILVCSAYSAVAQTNINVAVTLRTRINGVQLPSITSLAQLPANLTQQVVSRILSSTLVGIPQGLVLPTGTTLTSLLPQAVPAPQLLPILNALPSAIANALKPFANNLVVYLLPVPNFTVPSNSPIKTVLTLTAKAPI